MKSLILTFSIFLICIISNAQSEISIQWQKSYGGTGADLANSIQPTADGGYIFAGYSSSTNGDVTGNHGDFDYWVVKTDAIGTIQWQKSYGGSDDDEAASVIQTTDGGYLIVGTSKSNDGDVSGNHGYYDAWVVKTDPSGVIQWQKSYGGSLFDQIASAQQTVDGGYIFAGYSVSNDGDVTGNHGNDDYWVVKTDAIGAIQWRKSYGGSDNDAASNVKQTSDGGYILAGCSNSKNGDVTGNHGGYDYWIVKIDIMGAIQWQKSYGGSYDDGNYYDYSYYYCTNTPAIQQTTDNGFIVAGPSKSNDGDVTINYGGVDFWVVKTNISGSIEWQKTIGGSDNDSPKSIQQTTDGGYMIAGYTTSFGLDSNSFGDYNYWIVKTDPSGVMQWQKDYGGDVEDIANCIYQTTDGSYIIAGQSRSNSGDVTGNHGNEDFWIVKTCNDDPLSVVISDLEYCNSTTLIASSGFADYLWSTGETTQTINVSTGGDFSVNATNLTGCQSESQITVPFPVEPYSGEQICMVTMDEISGKNVIVIDKTLNVGTDSILIFRLNNVTSEYQQIGTIGIEEAGLFIDADAIPAQQSYQYKISVEDTCGKESNLSDVHRTILLQASTGINNEINLYWNLYEGFAYPNFEIYRSTGEDAYILIANVPNNVYTFTDLTPPAGSKKYQVRVSKQTTCNPAKSTYDYVLSNIMKLGTIGIDEKLAGSISVFPNPTSDILTIKISSSIDGSDYLISDQAGRVLLKGKLISEFSDLDISKLSPGMYVLQLGTQNNIRLKVLKK